MYYHDYWFCPYCDEHGQVFGLTTSSLPVALRIAREYGYKEMHVVRFDSDDSPATRVAVIRLIDGDVVYYGHEAVLKWIDPLSEYIDSSFDDFSQDFLYSHVGFDDSLDLDDGFPF